MNECMYVYRDTDTDRGNDTERERETKAGEGVMGAPLSRTMGLVVWV